MPFIQQHKRFAGPIAILILTQQGLLAADKFDPALMPSIFAPESAPAHSIMKLAIFVLIVTGVIFVDRGRSAGLCGGSFPPPRQ